MTDSQRPVASRAALALAGTASSLLWGVIELMALARSRWAQRRGSRGR